MTKRILFVHQNFPGQFMHLAPALARRGHDVLGLTADSNMRAQQLPIAKYRIEQARFPHDEWRIASHFAEQSRRGEHVAGAALHLKRSGYAPDLIIGHPGWGETMFLPDVWPQAQCLSYAEFYYQSRGQDVGFDPEFTSGSLRQDMRVRARQAAQLLALEHAHHAISPTRWQASTYPPHLRQKITVVHDGIDTERIRPDPQAQFDLPQTGHSLRHGDEVLTFVSRNLEPYRGFHVFMRSLPRILQQRPNAQVVIVGGDGQSYGGPPPGGGTWRETLLTEVGHHVDMSRVHFLGRIGYASFVRLMQITRVHAYLTYPFVLSWSFLEAMSAGAIVVASRTPPVEEMISHGENGLLVNFFDVNGWSDTISACLAEPAQFRLQGARARNHVRSSYDLGNVCLPKLIRLVESQL